MRFPSDVDSLLHLFGRIAQLVRALPLQGRGHRFDPCSAYHVLQRLHPLWPSLTLAQDARLSIWTSRAQIPSAPPRTLVRRRMAYRADTSATVTACAGNAVPLRST